MNLEIFYHVKQKSNIISLYVQMKTWESSHFLTTLFELHNLQVNMLVRVGWHTPHL